MSMTKGIRLIHDGHVKVYLGNLKQEHKFKFIYRDNYSNATRVCCKDTFPLELVYTHSGYLFVKGKRNTIAKQLNKLPLLENIYENDMITEGSILDIASAEHVASGCEVFVYLKAGTVKSLMIVR